jgi:gamma-glutamyltranspeptidase/glutathione hydrolase
MKMTRRSAVKGLLASGGAATLAGTSAAVGAGRKVDLSPASWPKGEYDRFMKAQGVDRTTAGAAKGTHGAVTVAYNGLAAGAGLEALKQGGNAIDAVMTGALAQIALGAGAPVSYFGIMSLIYHDAKTGKTHSMNAEWNTVSGENDAKTIPGAIDFSSTEALQGKGAVSGRTALVGGFMKGVEAGHKKFGRLPFASLFDPAIYVAEQGMPVTPMLAEIFQFRDKDIRRLPETRATLVKPDGKAYVEGDVFRQPRLAETLRAVARDGADYMYGRRVGEEAHRRDPGRWRQDDARRPEELQGHMGGPARSAVTRRLFDPHESDTKFRRRFADRSAKSGRCCRAMRC